MASLVLVFSVGAAPATENIICSSADEAAAIGGAWPVTCSGE